MLSPDRMEYARRLTQLDPSIFTADHEGWTPAQSDVGRLQAMAFILDNLKHQMIDRNIELEDTDHEEFEKALENLPSSQQRIVEKMDEVHSILLWYAIVTVMDYYYEDAMKLGRELLEHET